MKTFLKKFRAILLASVAAFVPVAQVVEILDAGSSPREHQSQSLIWSTSDLTGTGAPDDLPEESAETMLVTGSPGVVTTRDRVAAITLLRNREGSVGHFSLFEEQT